MTIWRKSILNYFNQFLRANSKHCCKCHASVCTLMWRLRCKRSFFLFPDTPGANKIFNTRLDKLMCGCIRDARKANLLGVIRMQFTRRHSSAHFLASRNETRYIIWFDPWAQKCTSLIHAQKYLWAARTVRCSICHYVRRGWESAVERLNIQIKPSKCQRATSSRLFSLWFQKKPIFGVKDFHLNLNDNIWFSSLSPVTPHFFIRKAAR